MESIERKHLRVRPLATLGDQKSEVYRLTFSPDGKQLVSTGENTCFWDEGADGSWHLQRSSLGVCLRLNPDQSSLLLFYKNHLPDRIELQDSTGRCLQTASCSQIKQRYCYGYSLDNKWLLTYDDDGWMYLWDAKTLHFASMFFLVPSRTPIHYVDRIHFTPDGEEFFFKNGGLVCRCQFRSEVPEIFAEGSIFSSYKGFFAEDLQISPRGDFIAFANSAGGSIDLYKIASLQHFASFPAGDSPIWLTFSPDGQYVASVDDESWVRIWNITTGQLEEMFVSHPGPLMEQMSAASSLAWSARGDILAVGGSLYEINDYSIKLWKVEYLS